jgi:hypothetical protein
MKHKFSTGIAAAVFAAAALTPSAFAQSLNPHQTFGFGKGKVLTFTYGQNFSCIHQPAEDLDFNGVPMESDPAEFQTPICQLANEPTIDPTGTNIKKTAHLYVIVPMFSVDNDQNVNDAMACPSGGRPLSGTQAQLCGPALGSELIALFGNIPEAWKTTVNPAITTQCPDPNGPGAGTCTTHASSLDLAPALAALGKIPAATNNIFLPTPNHSHIIDNNRINTNKAIWWEVRPVLIFNQSDWPAADASSGITSVKAMDDAEKDTTRAIEVPSNFFLFFSSKSGGSTNSATTMAGMPGM